ncbi:MAG: sigma-70 family RNA polymerase sigma factor [Clostridia bacterium]|nr:sigma-70 family RNA polymerase sigma factor [Clostridia bacterium]
MISDDHFTQETIALTPSLYRISMSILRHEADCRDAVQQALLNVWAARRRLEQTRFRAYLTRAVINECRNIQRKRMRETPIDEMPDIEYVMQPEQSELREAIDLLPESLRMPLLLHYMECFNEKETASALGITVVAVKNRLYRARKALKQQLKDWEVAPQ